MTNHDVILEKLKGIEKLFEEKFNQNIKQHNEITEVLDTKANKWVEKFTSGLISMVMVSVIGALLGMILIKPTMITMIYLANLIQYV